MARLRLHALLLSFAALPLLAGCGGDDKKSEAAFNVSDLKGFVMSPSDLPGGYKLVTEQASSSAQKCVGGKTSREQAVAAKFEQLGLERCASRTYRKRVAGAINKNNTPGSTMILLKNDSDASKALPELRKALVASYKPSGTASAGEQDDIPVSGLGEQSVPGARLTTDLGALGGDFDLYLYFWRRGNVITWMGSTDILGDFDERSTLELAEKLDARMADSG